MQWYFNAIFHEYKDPRTKMPRSKERKQRTNPCGGKEEIQKIKKPKGSEVE